MACALIAACAFASAAFATSAMADVVGPIGFEPPTYSLGTIDGQDGWSSDGAAGSGCGVYDHAVATNTGPAAFGSQSLRISNAVTSGCFGDQTFSKSLQNEAGEAGAISDGLSGGTRQPRFTAQWSFISTTPNAEQPGLSVVASPDRGDGARMSWVQMLDTPGGIDINFNDYQRGSADGFVQTNIATGLNRSVVHTVTIRMDLLDGDSNDVVKVYVDGALVHTGTSWEDFFRDEQPPGTRTVDSMLFRTGGTAAPGTLGKGFFIDGLRLESGPIPTCTQDTSGEQETGPVSAPVHSVDHALGSATGNPVGGLVHGVNCEVVVGVLGL